MKNDDKNGPNEQSENSKKEKGVREGTGLCDEPGMVDPRDLTATAPDPPKVVKPPLTRPKNEKDKDKTG